MTEEELIRALDRRAVAQVQEEGAVLGPPLADEDLSRAGERLGLAWPPLLTRIVREVGNGGWGPGYGLYPLTGPLDGPLQMALAELQESAAHKATACAEDGWPPHLLFLAYWGCTVHSILDLRTARVGLFGFSALEEP